MAPRKKPAAEKVVALPTAPPMPMDVQDLAKVTSIATKWGVGTEWTPQRIGAALRDAAQGNHTDFLSLAQDCEERYLHFASVLQTRKLGVIGKEIEVISGDGSSVGQTIADAYREQVVETEAHYELLTDLLDALSKGFSVCQPIWDTDGQSPFWNFKEFQFVDQRLFKYDDETMTMLRIDDGSEEGLELPPDQFVVHTPKLRSGIQIRTGLARAACIGYMFQRQAISSWSSFAEVYGMPLRIGKYDPLTSGPAEISKLRSAIVNLAFDAACVVPNDMTLEVLDARRPTSGDNVFEGLARFWDEQISKLVLGQTMTADNGSSEAQAKIHNIIRVDIAQADARSLSATIRNQVAKLWVRYNYGPLAPIPKFNFKVQPKEDLTAFSTAITPLINAGLRVSAKEVLAKFGLSVPAAADDVIEPRPTATAPTSVPAPVAPASR